MGGIRSRTSRPHHRPCLGLALAAVLASACGPGPSSATPSIAEPGASPVVASPPGTVSAGLGPPAALMRVRDQAALQGDGVFRPTVVALPDGSFLMLRSEDVLRGGVLLHSADGTQWAVLPGSVPGTAGTRVQAVAGNGKALAIVGGTPAAGGGSGDDFEPAVWSSSDGLTWDAEPKSVVAGMVPNLLAASPLAFVGVAGPSGQAWLGDSGGRSWTRVQITPGLDTGVSMNGVASAGDGFLAVGEVRGVATAWRSAEGRAWVRLPFSRPHAAAYRIASTGERIVISGTVTVVDPASPDGETTVAAAWLSTDGGATWRDAGLDLAGADRIEVFAIGDGFLASVVPHDAGRLPLAMWRSAGGGTWEPVRLGDGGEGLDLGWPSSVAVQGSRVVLVGSTVGTGAGGDQAVVWVGDAR